MVYLLAVKIALAEFCQGVRVLEIVDNGLGKNLPAHLTKPNLAKFIATSSKAQAILCPHNLRDIRRNKNYMRYLNHISEERPVILFNIGDFPQRQFEGNFFFIQTSIEVGFPFSKKQTVVVPWNAKPLNLSIRPPADAPVVSFMGYIPSLTFGRLSRSFLALPPYEFEFVKPRPLKRNSSLIRKLGSRQLLRNGWNSVPRKQYGGNPILSPKYSDRREEYMNLLNNSDFCFAPRGDANSSLRLFEALLSGRMPILPDSEVYLPQLEDNQMYLDFILFCRTTSLDISESVSKRWTYLQGIDYRDFQYSYKKYFRKHLIFESYISDLFTKDIQEWKLIEPFLFAQNH